MPALAAQPIPSLPITLFILPRYPHALVVFSYPSVDPLNMWSETGTVVEVECSGLAGWVGIPHYSPAPCPPCVITYQ